MDSNPIIYFMKYNFDNKKFGYIKTDNGSPAMAPEAAVCFYAHTRKSIKAIGVACSVTAYDGHNSYEHTQLFGLTQDCALFAHNADG